MQKLIRKNIQDIVQVKKIKAKYKSVGSLYYHLY